MSEQKEAIGARLRTVWDGFTPERKRITVLVALGAVLVSLVIWAVLSSETLTGGGGTRTAQRGQDPVDGFWWGGGRSNLKAIEDLSAEMTTFRRDFDRMKESNEEALAQIENTRDRFLNWAETTGVEQEAAKARRRLRELDQEIKKLEGQLESAETRAAGIRDFDPSRDYSPAQAPADPAPTQQGPVARETTSERPAPGEDDDALDGDLFMGVGVTPRQQSDDGSKAPPGGREFPPASEERAETAPESQLVINGKAASSLVAQAKEGQSQPDEQAEQSEAEESGQADGGEPSTPKKTTENTVPSGSIISGVLLHGMDAPTGSGARGQPVPVLIRVKDLTILPNQFAADFEDCHILGAGFGSMSEERAFIRLEGISCVDSKGGILEAKMSGYVVGEDGKVGMRGPIVQRNGALLAKSLQAGILGGFGSAIGGRRSGLVSVTTGGGVAERDLSEVGEEGLSRGVGTALQSLAEFYLEQAQAIFPVVVINSGRPVDVVLTAPFESGKLGEEVAG